MAAQLPKRFESKEYRSSYVEEHIRVFLANQIRSLRGDMTQTEFGRLVGKPASVISRIENENYSGVSLNTLLEIASALDVALLVRFVDFPTFQEIAGDMSVEAARPSSFSPGNDTT